MERLKVHAACAGVCLMLIGAAGCVAVAVAGGAAAGASAIYWAQGAMKTTFGYPIQDVHDATVQTLRSLGTGVVADKTESFSGEVETALRGGSDVRVYLKAISYSATEVVIRVGTFGDQQQSEMVLRAIESQLKTGNTVTPLRPSGG